MGENLQITVAIGTRPELIKLAPVVHTLRSLGVSTKVLLSGQHPSPILQPLLHFFQIKPDIEIPPIASQGNLSILSAHLLQEFSRHQKNLQSDYFLVQGDTTTATMGAYFAFCQKIPLVHIEAGLRTNNLSSPFPEEGNRQVISRLARWHFAPTFHAARLLMQEGVPRESLTVVGNTGIDALQFTLATLQSIEEDFREKIPPILRDFLESDQLVLTTIHRRENQGKKLEKICTNLLKLVAEMPGIKMILPVHPNPEVGKVVHSILGDTKNILLCEPFPYLTFVYTMSKAKLIITDSGGIQEEAPSLRVPVLVLRESTERPEAVHAGFAKLVGSDGDLLLLEAQNALQYGCTGIGENPYGNGTASRRIAQKLLGVQYSNDTDSSSTGANGRFNVTAEKKEPSDNIIRLPVR
jgi:UDP-N-acetylglucosamine 2-epimerase (non-hydrolysing)